MGDTQPPQPTSAPPLSSWQRAKKAAPILRRILFVSVAAGFALNAYAANLAQQEKLRIHQNVYIHWKIDKHGVIECRPESSGLSALMSITSWKQISLLEALETLEWIKKDDRIAGLRVDLSSSGGKSSQNTLGFAQIQELRQAILDIKEAKLKKFGPRQFRLQAITDTFESQNAYYLASVFDEIKMEPIGNIPLVGASSTHFFLKTMFEKLGIAIRTFALGEYKSVVSMFSETEMPEKQRRNLTDMLSSLNDQLIDGIVEARSSRLKMSNGSNNNTTDGDVEAGDDSDLLLSQRYFVNGIEEEGNSLLSRFRQNDNSKATSPTPSAWISKLMDFAPLSALESLQLGLIDRLGYKHDVSINQAILSTSSSPSSASSPITAAIAAIAPVTTTSISNTTATSSTPTSLIPSIFNTAPPPTPSNSNNTKFSPHQQKIRFMPLHLYRESRKREEAAKSSSSPALSPTVAIIYLVGTIYRGDGQFQSNAVTKAIIDAASNPKIDSIVLRIDSGGGDVVASDTIWNAVKRAQEKFGKPVVASYGNVSASGGYFISAGCRKIVANPGTITGSIGVATLRPVITEKLLSAIGVNVDQITFSNGAHNLSMFHDMDEAALRRHIQSTTHIYNEFKARVALGRSMDVAAVEKVAGGRVFTGSQAHKLGLIDHVGGLQSSIRIAAELGWKRRLGVDVNKAGIAVPENHQIEIYPKQKSWVEKLFDSDKTAAGKGEITVVFKELIKSSIEELIQEETPPAFEQSLLF